MQRIWSIAAIGLLVPAITSLGQQTIGRTSAQAVRVSGAVQVEGGEMLLGNGSVITAGEQAVRVRLERGGNLRLCQSTTLHLSQQKTSPSGVGGSLLLALDRGAFEAGYSISKGSDVLMTPDLRILVSGPGQADVRVRVNNAGDTCVENRGLNAPYVTVTEQIGDGVYRVQADQRVLFEHGSLRTVVDNEQEPCGCPPDSTLAGNAVSASVPVAGAVPNATTEPAKADRSEFPLAVSEGLAAPATTEPVVKPGETHVQVSTTLRYDGAPAAAPLTASPEPSAPATGMVAGEAAGAGASPAQQSAVMTKETPAAPAVVTAPVVVAERPGTAHPESVPAAENDAAPPVVKPVQHQGFFAAIGHLLGRLFGR